MEKHSASGSGSSLDAIPVWFIEREIEKTKNCFGTAKYYESLQLLLLNWKDSVDPEPTKKGAYDKWNS